MTNNQTAGPTTPTGHPTSDAGYVEVARAASFPAGTTRTVTAGDGPVLLANVDGEFYAVSGLCSHKKLPLQGARLDGCRLICPWHFTEFDVRTGEQVKWAYGGPLATYAVERRGDTLFLRSSSFAGHHSPTPRPQGEKGPAG